MAKFENYRDYSDARTEMAEKALLTAWDCLAAFTDELVLIGGLAIRYLTRPAIAGEYRPVTIDVDFGVTLGVSNGWYPSIKDNLAAHGFRWKGQRFRKDVEGQELFIDLLTDNDQSTGGSVSIDDGLVVSVVPGIRRALECSRIITIRGQNMIGAQVEQRVRVADVGPMLILKLNAFGGPNGRKAGKDIHDILHLVLDGNNGITSAVQAFAAETHIGNAGAATAVGCLREYFHDENALGPMSCAAFRMNNEHLRQERMEESLILRQQCVTLANELLRG